MAAIDDYPKTLEQKIVEKCIVIAAWNYRREKALERKDAVIAFKCNGIIRKEVRTMEELFQKNNLNERSRLKKFINEFFGN